MMVIRPVRSDDLEDLYGLAFEASDGLTTLPVSRERLAQRVEWSLEAFTTPPKKTPGSLYYFLVLEDTSIGKVVGTTGVFSQVGLQQPFYNYEIKEEIHSSSDPEVHSEFHSLHFGTPYKGYSELATLFLKPGYRKGGNGTLLSKSRFLLVASYPKRFTKNLMAEIRGWVDKEGKSPFWDAVGRNFFRMELVSADRINSFGNYKFIEDLMPKYPLYIDLLPKSARDVIGVTHEESAGARKILESEGLRFTGKVDVFDAGPCIDASQDQIRAIVESVAAKVSISKEEQCEGRYLIANPKLDHFRVISGPLEKKEKGDVGISKQAAEVLGVKKGDPVRYVRLKSKKV